MTPDASLHDLTAGASIDPTWGDRAECLRAGPDLHYPPKGGDALPAQRLCAVCPVRRECLAEAVRQDERHGIWGGMTTKNRRALARAAPHAVPDILDRHWRRLDALAAHTTRPETPPDVDDQILAGIDFPVHPNVAGELGVCTQGHPVAGDNAMPNGRYSDGRRRWVCRTCYEAAKADDAA